MPRFIAFLRAVNVGGRNVKMEELRALFSSMGFSKVETLIASGNVIFESAATSTANLQDKIEKGLQKSLGYAVKSFIRSDAEVAVIAHYQPFPAARAKSATVLNVGFMAAPLATAAARRWIGYKSEVDDFHVEGREAYWLCQIRTSESPFFKVSIEKGLGIQITFRNMNTVKKIAAKYPPKR
jgi:uncharacterized protein (DUF1697 family)